ncbi:hypothetical protein DFH29DRAFT_877076 [Suillus ampliporus]|nr:hypothetical protein DFH29DRAFT_877076 [Suillus ampliporus]
MFPVFLALMRQDHSTSACLQRHSPLDMEIIESTSLLFPFPTFPSSGRQGDSNSASLQGCFPPDMEIIHAMRAFDNFASEARERTRSASDALKYACQNWIVHLSRAANPWDESLNRTLKLFWNRHLLSWLERQWCLKDLRSCLTILSEGEKLVKDHFIQASGSSQSRI